MITSLPVDIQFLQSELKRELGSTYLRLVITRLGEESRAVREAMSKETMGREITGSLKEQWQHALAEILIDRAVCNLSSDAIEEVADTLMNSITAEVDLLVAELIQKVLSELPEHSNISKTSFRSLSPSIAFRLDVCDTNVQVPFDKQPHLEENLTKEDWKNDPEWVRRVLPEKEQSRGGWF